MHIFVFSIKGLQFIHSSRLRAHGSLITKSCLVDEHFTLKIGDLGYTEIRSICNNKSRYHSRFETVWWRPHHISQQSILESTQAQILDIQAFGGIASEICFSSEPQGSARHTATLKKLSLETEQKLIALLRTCEDSSDPAMDIRNVNAAFIKLFPKTKRHMVEILISRASAYAQVLEDSVLVRTAELLAEQTKADYLLEQMLPRQVML